MQLFFGLLFFNIKFIKRGELQCLKIINSLTVKMPNPLSMVDKAIAAISFNCCDMVAFVSQYPVAIAVFNPFLL